VLYYGFGFQLFVTMKLIVIYFHYSTMCTINMSKSNTTNHNITDTIVNSFALPKLNIPYVCPCTMPDILSYITVKDRPCTKLNVTVNRSCLLV